MSKASAITSASASRGNDVWKIDEHLRQLNGAYYVLLLSRRVPTDMHSMEAKKQLASEIVARYTHPKRRSGAGGFQHGKFSKRDLEHA